MKVRKITGYTVEMRDGNGDLFPDDQPWANPYRYAENGGDLTLTIPHVLKNDGEEFATHTVTIKVTPEYRKKRRA